MNLLAEKMDPKIVEQITNEIGSSTPQEFLHEYIQIDPSFENILNEIGYTAE